MGFVYLILQIDSNGLETYKIGVSKNDPQLRLKQLSTGNPNEIRVINSYKTENYNKVEKWLHRKYATLKTLADNEWFSLTSEQVLSFFSECKKADETISFLKNNNSFYS